MADSLRSQTNEWGLTGDAFAKFLAQLDPESALRRAPRADILACCERYQSRWRLRSGRELLF
jgi:hypothetical protein